MLADDAWATAVSGQLNDHEPVSTLPRTATIGAISLNLSRISGSPTSPAWTISSEPRNASNASSRNNPCVSEISPIRAGSLRMEMLGIGSAGDTAQDITEKTLQD